MRMSDWATEATAYTRSNVKSSSVQVEDGSKPLYRTEQVQACLKQTYKRLYCLSRRDFDTTIYTKVLSSVMWSLIVSAIVIFLILFVIR